MKTIKSAKYIFVVDDAEWHNILLKKMLGDSGYKVRTFTDGFSLLENLEMKKPHMIISDINMPGLNGFELCERIKRLPECKNIPVVYVSSMKEEEVYILAEERGIAGYMQKPLDKEPFLDVVAQKL